MTIEGTTIEQKQIDAFQKKTTLLERQMKLAKLRHTEYEKVIMQKNTQIQELIQ